MRQVTDKYKESLRRSFYSIVNWDELLDKTILITGATGTIGSYIVDMLIQYGGCKVIATSRSKQKLVDLFGEPFGESDGSALIYQSNTEEIKEDVDYVICLAGGCCPNAFNSPIELMNDTINEIKNLQNKLDYRKVKKIVYISSRDVYDVDRGHTGKESDCIINEKMSYPVAKLQCELLWHFSPFVSSVARLSHTYGPQMNGTDDRAHAEFLRCAKRGDAVDPHSCLPRNYNYVGNAAAQIMTILLNGKNKEVYNVANDEVTSIFTFAKIVSEISGAPFLSNHAYNTSADNTITTDKLKSLGYVQEFDLREGIEYTLESM